MFTIYTAHISLNGSHFLLAGFLEYYPYKVNKNGSGFFSYALQPAKRPRASFMGAILEEYLVVKLHSGGCVINRAYHT